VHILGFMQRSHVETNAIVCNAAINACGRAEYWPHALQILVMMEKAAEMVISKDADEKLVEGHQILTKTHHDDP